MPPQQTSNITIPTPVQSGATDNPNAPQNPASANNPVATYSSLQNDASYFPLLSKSPGFADAMIKANKSGDFDNDSTMPLPVVMERNLRTLEGSDIYKNASATKRMAYQLAFFKRFVEPLERSTGTKVDFKEWLKDRGTYWQYQVNPESQHKPAHGLIPASLVDTKKEKEQSDALSSGVLSTQLKTAQAIETAKIKFKEISRDLSFGSALLNAEIAPHMGPIIMNPHYEEVRQRNDTLQQYLKADEWVAEHGYTQNLTNKILHGTGEFAGQAPAFMASDGILGAVGVRTLLGLDEAGAIAGKGIGQAAEKLPMEGMAKVAKHAIYNGAQGYLIGASQGDDPNKTAAEWAGGSLILGAGAFEVSEGLISPAMKYLGRIFGWGGGKLVTAYADQAANAVKANAPETTVSPVTTVMAGSPKQKINASVVQALNDLTGGNFSKAPDAAKKQALDKLAKVAPEFAEQIGFIDKTVVGANAAQDLIRQRSAVPELDNAFKEMEKAYGKPAHEVVANAVQDKAVQQARRSTDKWVQDIFRSEDVRNMISKDLEKHTGTRRATDIVPGAAGAKSLEFGDNLSKFIDGKLEKLGMKNLSFEQRKDKFLFFLNLMQYEQRRLGPSAERNKVFHALLNKLQEEFPGEEGRLPNLLSKSEKIWNDLDTLSKSGHFKGDEPFRYWRQHSRPGQAPFSWEVEASQKAAQVEAEQAKAAKEVSQAKPLTDDEKLKAAFSKATEKKRDTNVMASALEELFPGKKYGELTPAEQSKVATRAGEIAKELNKKK